MGKTVQSEHGERLRLSYLLGGLAIYRPGEVLGPRRLFDYECVAILEGEARYVVEGGGDILIPVGGILLTRPGFKETYQWGKARQTRHAYFHFAIEEFPLDWPEPACWPIAHPKVSPLVQALYREVIDRIQIHPDWPAQPPDIDTNRLVETLISILLRPASSQVIDPSTILPLPVQRAIHVMRLEIEEPTGRPVQLGKLAAAAGVTPKHLCALFAGSIGHPPLRTFRLLQLQLAVPLLARTDFSVKEVARHCRFQDPYYFTRYFTQIFGESPSEVRRRMRAGGAPPRNPLPPDLAPRIFW
jgi:AraC-like DNA-binding protein